MNGREKRVSGRARRLEGARPCRIHCLALAPDELEIIELSAQGARVMLPRPSEAMEGIHSARFVIEGVMRVMTSIRIVWLTDDEAGLEFLDPSGQVRRSIEEHYAHEVLAASLFPHESSENHELVYENDRGDSIHIQNCGPCARGELRLSASLHSFGTPIVVSARTFRDPRVRTRLLRVVRNLPQLAPGMLERIERTLSQ